MDRWHANLSTLCVSLDLTLAPQHCVCICSGRFWLLSRRALTSGQDLTAFARYICAVDQKETEQPLTYFKWQGINFFQPLGHCNIHQNFSHWFGANYNRDLLYWTNLLHHCGVISASQCSNTDSLLCKAITLPYTNLRLRCNSATLWCNVTVWGHCTAIVFSWEKPEM